MRLDLPTITRLLSSIVARPDWRRAPRAGDLQGTFDGWFNDGAVREVTGWTEYHFVDGTLVVVPGSSARVDIQLPAGGYVSITCQSEAPPFFPRRAV
jgi:hypothetical protein